MAAIVRRTFTYYRSGPPLPAANGAGGIGFLTERGNVRALGAANASLFDIPAGFTKTP